MLKTSVFAVCAVAVIFLCFSCPMPVISSKLVGEELEIRDGMEEAFLAECAAGKRGDLVAEAEHRKRRLAYLKRWLDLDRERQANPPMWLRLFGYDD